ncbi:Filamin/ABP280 repeat protein [Dictyocaulus viviparus]|uniref:Filamin/ABP280 repeat protein n=1 Tax=Dictyocaulus viviparus TaxID=29172 RepID=A0A0D8XDF2_DICVI|nr:Filamin/ABP280 repeat protein [Dictyocaulus viviparus]
MSINLFYKTSKRVELPSSPIFLHVLSLEESSVDQLPLSKSLRDDVTAISSESNVQKSDSCKDVDISYKSFAEPRFHTIKQLKIRNNPGVRLEPSVHQKMTLRSADIGLVSFSGLSEPCSVGSIVEVVINAHGECEAGSVQVDAMSPNGRTHNCIVSKRDKSYTATFTPQQVGVWKIGVLYNGEHIRGSPFSCQVFDASLVQVYGLDVGLVGQELKFNINTSEAGQGNLEVTVLRQGRHIPVRISEEYSPQVYRVIFVPDGAGQYRIHVLFNRMEVKGSPFILEIADVSTVSVFGDQLHGASVGRPASFMIHAPSATSKDITVEITGMNRVFFLFIVVFYSKITVYNHFYLV